MREAIPVVSPSSNFDLQQNAVRDERLLTFGVLRAISNVDVNQVRDVILIINNYRCCFDYAQLLILCFHNASNNGKYEYIFVNITGLLATFVLDPQTY